MEHDLRCFIIFLLIFLYTKIQQNRTAIAPLFHVHAIALQTCIAIYGREKEIKSSARILSAEKKNREYVIRGL